MYTVRLSVKLPHVTSRKLVENMPHQSEGVNQETGLLGIPETERGRRNSPTKVFSGQWLLQYSLEQETRNFKRKVALSVLIRDERGGGGCWGRKNMELTNYPRVLIM